MNAVDTNVLIYAVDKRFPAKQEIAIAVVESLKDGVIPWQVACEFVAASRKLQVDGLASVFAWNVLSQLLQSQRLFLPTPATLTSARDLHLAHQIAFWDALLYAACVEAGVSTIFSEDLPGGIVPNLKIVNPFDAMTAVQ